MIRIQPFEKGDWAATWRIIEPVFRAGETYAFSPDITEEEAHKVWIQMPSATFVAVDETNRHLGLTSVTADTLLQKMPGVKGLRLKCAGIRSVRPYRKAFERCSTIWLFQ
jgi:hypothetical protein